MERPHETAVVTCGKTSTYFYGVRRHKFMSSTPVTVDTAARISLYSAYEERM